MANKNVEYIKSHVENDIRLNKERNGGDYSIQLGAMLNIYLNNQQDKTALVSMGVLGLGKLEERIEQTTGKRPVFHETKKCGLPIHLMWKERDSEGLAEIQDYADQLVGRGFRINGMLPPLK